MERRGACRDWGLQGRVEDTDRRQGPADRSRAAGVMRQVGLG